MINAVLMRGSERYKVLRIREDDLMGDRYSIRHDENFTPIRVLDEDNLFPSGLTSYVEHFRKANWRCPLCDCICLNSENYMSLPDHILARAQQ